MRNRSTRTEADASAYGFRWGPLDVTRITEYRGSHALEIATDHTSVEVYVSKGGHSIRVYKNGKEMKTE